MSEIKNPPTGPETPAGKPVSNPVVRDPVGRDPVVRDPVVRDPVVRIELPETPGGGEKPPAPSAVNPPVKSSVSHLEVPDLPPPPGPEKPDAPKKPDAAGKPVSAANAPKSIPIGVTPEAPKAAEGGFFSWLVRQFYVADPVPLEEEAKKPPAGSGAAAAVTEKGQAAVITAASEEGPKNLRPPVVTFRNVSKVFNLGTRQEYCAIKDISFEIEDIPDIGEFIALIGPSGCGKSTVLNLIEAFPEVAPPTTGEILVRGRPVTGPGKDRGMIFQKYSSFPHLTVLQNVLFGLEINNGDKGLSKPVMKAMAMDLIKKVGLLGHENKFPCQLSGGQQQRVAIARSLVLKPRIILMDEPFSALDEPTRIDMQALITELWHEVEATVFIVTHSIAEAVYLGDRIFMFTPGPGRLAKVIMIKPEDIGKIPGKSPLEIQESQKFKNFLKHVTEEFLKVEGGKA